MAVRKAGLGKGLDSLIPEHSVRRKAEKTEQKPEKNELLLKITDIEPNREQPRKHFDEDALLELSDSIKQFGIIQPLIVQKKEDHYEIIAGERRWRAAKMAGLKEVPAIIKSYTDREILEISLIENIQRENLNPIDEARAYKKLLTEFHLKQDEVAERVSKSRTAVTNSMRLLKLDKRNREIKQEVEALRAERNKLSKEIGGLMKQGKKEEAEEVKRQVAASADRINELSAEEAEVEEKLKTNMMVIPNIIDPSVPIGKDDSENVEIERFGEPVVPDFEIPYHTEIMESFNGIDLDSARKVAGNGFYYLMGDIARLHSAVIAYARDFMINRGFTYCVPPFMIRSNVVTGVMSFAEMDSMMYKIEGEDLYLIGTSEHSMIGKFIDTIIPEEELPKTLTSYSPCFRKEKGAHGIEERGVYRIHQFEKQEMIVVCKPEESKMWYEKLWKNTVDLFRSMDIPVRTLECCSGDLADLKVKSVDVEAWSPRQKKYFEVGSCSNLGDAQARRLKIRVNGESGKYFAHTLNNTVVAPPRMLIAFLENNLQADGSVKIPEVLQPYMGGMKVIEKK